MEAAVAELPHAPGPPPASDSPETTLLPAGPTLGLQEGGKEGEDERKRGRERRRGGGERKWTMSVGWSLRDEEWRARAA